jgi:hypothetical protein
MKTDNRRTDNRRKIKWEDQSTESKKRLLGGQKTTVVSNKMDYTDVPKGRNTIKPVNVGKMTTVTKTNKKGDVVKEKKIITPKSGPTTVVKTNRNGKDKIKTKRN